MDTQGQLASPQPRASSPSAESALRIGRPPGPHSAFTIGVLFVGIGYFWFRLVNNLRLEWTTNPQYGYGWVVPLLCIGLLIRRWQRKSPESCVHSPESGKEGQGTASAFCFLLSAFVAFLYLPTRLVEAATPEWRPIQWALGVEAVGLTLCAIYLIGGKDWLKRFAFPMCFFFVAIPWPTLIEIPIIQNLARLNASIVVEVLGAIGIPTMQHGNVLEVSTGVVGIDDACSGIRSFQSSLMISLFLGEFYRLSTSRRILLVPLGFILAIVFNVCRTSLLTFIAAKKGIAAISQYHDEAGVTILLACTAATWLVALLLRPRVRVTPDSAQKPVDRSEIPKPDITPPSGHADPLAAPSLQPLAFSLQPSSAPLVLSLALLAWLMAVEIGVQLWYHIRESHIQPGPTWSVSFPEANPTFKNVTIAPKTSYLLRFDEGKEGQWQTEDGAVCQAFFFSWVPGRVAGYLAKRHTPDICMPAAGQTLRTGPDLMVLKVHGVELPMRSYLFDTPGGPVYVYQCRWEAGEGTETYVAQESARFNLVRGIWAGRGIHGQKVLEIILSGCSDAESAKHSLLKQLDSIIKVQTSVAENLTSSP